jgi:hypothetical protein
VPAPVIDLSKIPEDKLDEAKLLLAELEQIRKDNPLFFFEAHGDAQRTFLEARTRIVAAFAGNRFGKTTALIVKALAQALDDVDLPEHVRPYRQVPTPNHGWILCPSEAKIDDSLMPALKKWCPARALKGGNIGKAYNGDKMTLSFANGSTIGFKTYKQDAGTLGGADLDWVGYDEPPPKGHRNECIIRMARGVREWYAMTPIRVNVAWILREIWQKRADPDITVVRGQIHDNPTLSARDVQFILSTYTDTERQSRESGDFMSLSGLVYPNFETAIVPDQPRTFVHSLEHIVGIDPGIRNAAFVFGGFDQHGVDWVWDVHLIQDGTPSDYAEGIDAVLRRWGLRREQVLFVIDPAARQRSQATGDTVQSELARVGIFTINGNRDREAGQQQIRDRLKWGRIKVFQSCVGLRDEAEEFAYALADEGKVEDQGPADDSPFHRLATLRYQVMTRPWFPHMEETAADRNLGWVPGTALRPDQLRIASAVAPMGPLS